MIPFDTCFDGVKAPNLAFDNPIWQWKITGLPSQRVQKGGRERDNVEQFETFPEIWRQTLEVEQLQ